MDSSVIISVAGILATATVGGLGLYFTYRARTQPYQQTLYGRQLDLLAEVLAAIEDVHYTAVVFSSSDDEDQINQEAKRFPERNGRLLTLLPRVTLLLPGDFYEALYSFSQSSATFCHSCLASPRDIDKAGPALVDMGLIRMRLMIRAREIAGTAPLTQQTSALISNAPEFSVSDDELIRQEQKSVDERARNLDKNERYAAPAR
jgi:hypothetical protein